MKIKERKEKEESFVVTYALYWENYSQAFYVLLIFFSLLNMHNMQLVLLGPFIVKRV
jgi:hypothetical protein